jgi:hypothetical protein
MNLQEDINRIKEVMGINEGSMNPFLLRRIPEFVSELIDVADLIYVRSDREYSDHDFLNFVDRVIFGSVRHVIGTYDLTHDELKKLEIILWRVINRDKHLFQTLQQIYFAKLDSI